MNQTKIWEHFQNDESAADTFNARGRYRFLARRCIPGSRVLNIGVGSGGLEEILVAAGVNVSALDPSERSISSLRKRLGLGEKAKVGFSQALPFDGASFDIVVMSEVLEHLPDDTLQSTIAEVRRVLQRDGLFIGTVPAEENLQEGKTVCPHCGEVFHRWGHVQSFSRARLQSLLSENFSQVKTSRHFFADLDQLNWKGKVMCMAKYAAVRAGIRGSGETFFFEAVSA